MIALISGRVAVRRPDHVIVDCGGVGYRLTVSAETLRHVPGTGNEVSLHTHMVVRDDALALYGFSSETERDLFLMLLAVQTVGPKMAIAVLSGAPPRELLAAVAAGDVSRLRAPGVGKRTAERIISELREKVSESIADEISVARVPDDDPRAQAREALLGLGYGADEISGLLDGADGASVQELISHALRSARR
jgi:holliday junction DNA helicase RuvA